MYETVKDALIRRLESAATAQQAGRDQEIAVGFCAVADLFDPLRISPWGHRPEVIKLHTAMAFWNAWVGASYREWKSYEGISKPEWPALARRVADDLRADRDISDPMVLRHFDLSKYWTHY